VLTLLLAQALAATDPCYGHSSSLFADSDHFWVEWEPGTVDEDQAQAVLTAAEHGRETWLAMGYGFTDEAVRIDLVYLETGGVSGLTTTQNCDGTPVPAIQLFFTAWDRKSVIDVVTHETVHAAQYADMGSYADSVASWLWWMEGHATWMTPLADTQWHSFTFAVNGYTLDVGRPLQHGIEGFADEGVQRHMYGTAWVVQALAIYAGEAAVRATWAWGADHTGAPIWFPDAVTGAGVDFDAFWAWYLAMLPTMALDHGDATYPPLPDAIATQAEASGDLTIEGALGAAIVQIPASRARGGSLDLTVSGDDVPWSVVLVRTHDGAVIDFAPIPVVGGAGEGWITGFDDVDGWIVASPMSQDGQAHTLRWATTPGKHREPMDGVVVIDDSWETGCAHTSIASVFAVLVAAAAQRRRR
jgi:hypothetical protein